MVNTIQTLADSLFKDLKVYKFTDKELKERIDHVFKLCFLMGEREGLEAGSQIALDVIEKLNN